MSKNIAAWTEAVTPPPSQYVQYISINTAPRDRVTVTVRNRQSECVEVELSTDEFRALLKEAVERLA
jgi:hypothetical protein